MPNPTVHLFSFGYKHSGPPPDEGGHGGGFVFDCRGLPNPFWDEALRPYAGTAPPVIAYFEARPEIGDFARHAAELVLYTTRKYARENRERLYVAFGCTGGRHRSVYMAERLKGELERAGFSVVLTHRDLHRADDGPAPAVQEAGS